MVLHFYPGIFHLKSEMILGLCIFLENTFFRQYLLGGFEINYPANMGNGFGGVLVVVYV